MAHLIKLNALDINHDNGNSYVEILFNLDKASTIERSRIHSVIYTENNPQGIRVKESLEDILAKSKNS